MTSYLKLIRMAVLLSLACFVCLTAHAQQSANNESGLQLPPYVRVVDKSSMSEDGEILVECDCMLQNDSLFYNISRGVIFPVNKYYLNPKDRFLRELKDEVLPEVKRRKYELVSIGLRGAASPEGPYRWNVTLSKRRAQAILDFLKDHLGLYADYRLAVKNTPEDYFYLVFMMEEAGDPETELVRGIVERYRDDDFAMKKALQKEQGGKLWRRLLKTYYPGLRAARIVMCFRPIKTVWGVRSITVPEPNLAEVVNTRLKPVTLLPMPTDEKEHVLSVGTNLLYDAFYMPNYGMAPMPNIELEYYPRTGNFTYLAAFTGPYWHRWNKQQFFQIRDYHLEARYYFNPAKSRGPEASDSRGSNASPPRIHTGTFLAAYVNANIYGIGLNKQKGWEGEGIGGALKVGYVCRLSPKGRWRLEVSAAFGGYLTRFDPYVYGNPINGTEDGDYYYDYTGPVNDFIKRNHQRIWFGPTELGIRVKYDVLFRRKGVAR